MSLHERSPLCIEYKEYYKDGTSKFRRELDQKNQTQHLKTGQDDKQKNCSIYTEYIGALNQGPESTTLK